MSERYYQQKSVSNRSLLCDAIESDITDYIEKMYLTQYKKKINEIQSKQTKLSEIRKELRELSLNEESRESVNYKNLQSFATRIANSIDSCERELLDLEKSKALQDIIEREREKIRKQNHQEGIEQLNAYREQRRKELEEFSNRYRVEREEVLKRFAEKEKQKEQDEFLKSYQTAKQKAVNATNEKLAKHAEEKYKGTRTCALVLSLLLSIVLLFGLIAQFTTTEEVTTYEKQTKIETIATYRCYVTATGVCYHSRTCQYIRNDDVESYVSTVYEAEQEGLRPCSKCRIGASQKAEIEVNKFVSVPKTEKHTKTNYFAAIIISVIFAVLLYNLIVFKSRKEYKNFK
jgi:hypothetical protein